ncbi:MAG TPA: putative sulfate exporter family transporter [Candidatus Dietzia intestinigallinarum]|nr:putative sulfate exporter family transporter [Candidatus Dietzia intestinigallinarum]
MIPPEADEAEETKKAEEAEGTASGTGAANGTGTGSGTGTGTGARAIVPGLALCGLGTILALVVGWLIPTVSPLLVAILLGALLVNLGRVSPAWRPGLAVASTKFLRVGIAVLGLQVALGDILGLGWPVLVVVVSVVVLGIAGTMFVGALLGLGWTQRVLIACGFSICGAAAVAAVDGVVDAREEEVATAIALVVVFGTLMIPVVPLAAAALGMPEAAAGAWAGGSIHEVAQVVAAGGAIGGSALAVAVTVKLARVLLLAPVVTVLGLQARRRSGAVPGRRRPPLVPLFIVAFLACVLLRSSGLLGPAVLDVAGVVQTVLLTAAMFALGTGVRVATLREVGARPFVLAAASTVWVAGIALVGVQVAGVAA